MIRKCCCGTTSICDGTCLCSTTLKQIYIQVGIDAEVCWYQGGNQATRIPVSCSSDIAGAVADNEFYEYYDQELYNCKWGNIYDLQRITGRSYYCPGGCSECQDEDEFDCCWSHPNGGPCYPLAGDCDLPECDCDGECCRLQYPPGPDRDACNQACFEQRWQRFCKQGSWKTDIVGEGLSKMVVKKPATMECGFAIKRNENPVTFGDLQYFSGSTSVIDAGSDTMEDGTLLIWGQGCPAGETCTSWGLNGSCGGNNIVFPWYGYARKTGRAYAVLNGWMKAEAQAGVFESPQNGSSQCYSTQFTPNQPYQQFFFKVLYEGIPSGNQLRFEQVNSVAGPSSFAIPDAPSSLCKCPGYIGGGESIQYWKVGGAYASGFTI